MAKTNGMLSLAELGQQISTGEVDTVIVAFTDHYGRLLGKRLDPKFFLKQHEQGIGACNYLLTVDMEMKPVDGYDYANWKKGYGDFLMFPDLNTLRRASWLEKTAIVLSDLREEQNNAPVTPAPRSILKSVIEQVSSAGFSVKAASELEYYLYKDSYRLAASKNYSGLQAAGWYIEDYHLLQASREEFFHGAARRHLTASGIPVENSKGEFGLGQHELNVEYTDVLTMADRHSLFKQCLKELADQMDVSVTFMAKPDDKQAGSSCHLHVSLWQGEHNVFAGDEDYAGLKCSDQFRWFLGGWMKFTPELMPFYASTINAYKRYQDASWAPTRLAWSVDNRTAGFRIVGHGDSLRIECRIPGADCNPYLAFAAAVASGIEGIKQKIEPPPVFNGDVYADKDLPRIPTTLQQATERLAQSKFARQMFGDTVVDHYLHFFKSELASYDRAVTDWELKRYFERI